MSINKYWETVYRITDSSKWLEQTTIKFQLFEKLFDSLNIDPVLVIFAGFNPLVLEMEKHYRCIVVADVTLKAQWQSSSEFVTSFDQISEPVSCVFALDEYFTYAANEQDQRNLLQAINDNCRRAVLITTLQDYKNTAPHKRSNIESITNTNSDIVMLDQNIQNKDLKQNWQNYIYFIENHVTLKTIGPIERRTMYFKQLAKYTSDIAANEYTVHKNLLYRGYFKRYYEHIITVRIA